MSTCRECNFQGSRAYVEASYYVLLRIKLFSEDTKGTPRDADCQPDLGML
jgi:hypothetical protein